MADDLSRSNTRRGAQDRVTENRDAIAPTRRETRTPDAQVRSDMRSAYRGDGGVEQINRFFKQLEGANAAYQEADIAQTRQTAEVAYADGMTDASAGREMDPAQQQAVAYQRAYFSVTAAARQTKFETETAQELDRMINEGSTVEEIEAYMSESAREFIAETSDVYELPDVKRGVGERLMRWSNETNARANTILKTKTDQEMVRNTVGEIQAGLARGENLDLIGVVDTMKAAGLDGVAVQDEIVNGVIAYATETGDLTGLHALNDTRRATDVAQEIEDVRANETATTAPTEAIEGAPLPSGAEPAPKPAPAAATTYIAPVPMGRITSGMGQRAAPLAGASTNHGGLDIAVPIGTPVKAPAAGVVEFAGPRGRGGNTVLIKHADGTTTGYAHLDRINVKAGDTVTQGMEFAASGNSGNSTGPHLHWSARRNGQRIDPRTIVGQPAPAGETAATEADAPAVVESKEEVRRQRAPGASVLTPAQQLRVLNAIEAVQGDTERKTEKARVEAKEDLTLDLWTRAQGGADVSDIINENVRTGVLEPNEGMVMTNAFRALRNDQLEGEANEDLSLNYTARFAVAEPNFGKIMSDLDRDYSAGRFGTGRSATRTYLELKNRAASGSRADRGVPPEERRTATVARGYVGQSIGQLVGPVELSTPERRRLGAEAMIEWERRVAGGKAPMAAADEIVVEYGPRFNAPRQTAAASGGSTRAPGTSTTSGGSTTRVDRNGNIIN